MAARHAHEGQGRKPARRGKPRKIRTQGGAIPTVPVGPMTLSLKEEDPSGPDYPPPPPEASGEDF